MFNMFPKWITNVLKYYTLWGFYSISFYSIDRKYINLFAILINVSFYTWASFSFLDSFIQASNVVGILDALNMASYYICMIGTYWIIICDCISKRRFQHAFWKTCRQINENFIRQAHMNKSQILAILIIYSITDVIILLVSIHAERVTSAKSKVMHIFFVIVFDQRVSFFIFHTIVVEFQLKNINSELMVIRKHRPIIEGDSFDGGRFKWIRDYYELVFHMSENVNEIFGWSHLALIMVTFFTFVTLLNSVYNLANETFSGINGVNIG